MLTPAEVALLCGVEPRLAVTVPPIALRWIEGAPCSSSSMRCSSGVAGLALSDGPDFWPDSTVSAIRSASRSKRSLLAPIVRPLVCIGKLPMELESAPGELPPGGNEPPLHVDATAASEAKLLLVFSAAFVSSAFACTWSAALRVLVLESEVVVNADT